jgi:hypothetical protein
MQFSSNLLLLHPFWVQIFSSEPCSQTPSIYCPPLMSETSFTPIQNHRQNYSFEYFKFYVFRQQTRRQKVLVLIAHLKLISETVDWDCSLTVLLIAYHFQLSINEQDRIWFAILIASIITTTCTVLMFGLWKVTVNMLHKQ